MVETDMEFESKEEFGFLMLVMKLNTIITIIITRTGLNTGPGCRL